MTFAEFLAKLNAWALVTPALADQKLYDIRVMPDGTIKITLEESKLSIPIT